MSEQLGSNVFAESENQAVVPEIFADECTNENLENSVEEWGDELTSIVSENADLLVLCPWMGNASVTLAEAMTTYSYPENLTAADEPFLISVVTSLLANRLPYLLEPEVEDIVVEDIDETLEAAEPANMQTQLETVAPEQPQLEVAAPDKPEQTKAKQPIATATARGQSAAADKPPTKVKSHIAPVTVPTEPNTLPMLSEPLDPLRSTTNETKITPIEVTETKPNIATEEINQLPLIVSHVDVVADTQTNAAEALEPIMPSRSEPLLNPIHTPEVRAIPEAIFYVEATPPNELPLATIEIPTPVVMQPLIVAPTERQKEPAPTNALSTETPRIMEVDEEVIMTIELKLPTEETEPVSPRTLVEDGSSVGIDLPLDLAEVIDTSDTEGSTEHFEIPVPAEAEPINEDLMTVIRVILSLEDIAVDAEIKEELAIALYELTNETAEITPEQAVRVIQILAKYRLIEATISLDDVALIEELLSASTRAAIKKLLVDIGVIQESKIQVVSIGQSAMKLYRMERSLVSVYGLTLKPERRTRAFSPKLALTN